MDIYRNIAINKFSSMGTSKTEVFSTYDLQVAKIAKAIAHPARVAILQFLSKHGTCFCGDIVSVIPLSQATVSQHLQVLKEAGLIKGTITAPKVCYCIDTKQMKLAQKLLSDLLEPPELSC